jgi:hypothetical protein
MGTMRFRVFPTERITAEMVQQAYLSGTDRISWPVRVTVEGEELILQRSVSDSANLHVPWPVEGHGTLTLASATLIERPDPYLLPLELARGTIVQVRNQLSEWQAIGLCAPDAVHAKLATAVERLSWASVGQADTSVSAGHAEQALGAALDSANLLAAAYAEQAIVVRRRGEEKPFGLLGADLGMTLLDDYTSRQFLRTFNAAQVPICWRDTETTEAHMTWTINDRQIEWCRAHGLKIFAGPMLMFDARALPDWLSLFADDFEAILDFVSVFIRAAVERYRGKVDYWICAGRVNATEVLALSEQERLQLVAGTVELIHSLDPDAPTLVSFDQPWAEHLRQQHSDFPALHFADALVRAGLDLGGLMMEINVGYCPGCTLPRHVLEFSRQLDTWCKLGLPLWLSLSAPSAGHDDPKSQRNAATAPGGWTPAAQQAWAARFVPLALAKPSMQGVVWNQLRDSEPHDLPHAGLFDADCHTKPALRTLAAIRQAYLK